MSTLQVMRKSSKLVKRIASADFGENVHLSTEYWGSHDVLKAFSDIFKIKNKVLKVENTTVKIRLRDDCCDHNQCRLAMNEQIAVQE